MIGGTSIVGHYEKTRRQLYKELHVGRIETSREDSTRFTVIPGTMFLVSYDHMSGDMDLVSWMSIFLL